MYTPSLATLLLVLVVVINFCQTNSSTIICRHFYSSSIGPPLYLYSDGNIYTFVHAHTNCYLKIEMKIFFETLTSFFYWTLLLWWFFFEKLSDWLNQFIRTVIISLKTGYRNKSINFYNIPQNMQGSKFSKLFNLYNNTFF